MNSSRIPGFYNMTVDERRKLLSEQAGFTEEEVAHLLSTNPLSLNTADNMIENVIGTYQLPLGVGLNFLINGKEYAVPMAIEEPSVVASASNAAKIVRNAGGFTAEATDRIMIGQIQVVGCPDLVLYKNALLKEKDMLLERANAAIQVLSPEVAEHRI